MSRLITRGHRQTGGVATVAGRPEALSTTSHKCVTTAAPGRACSVRRNSLRSNSPRPPQALLGSALDINLRGTVLSVKRSGRRLAGALAFWLGSAAVPVAYGQAAGTGPRFEVSAQVPTQDDAARARSRALLDAMNQALEQAVTQAAPEARGRLYLLASRARDYITTYRVLEEGETGGQFLLRLEAQVDLPRLLRDLQGTVPATRQVSGQRAALLLCATPTAPVPGRAEPEAVAATIVDQARTLLAERGETVELLTPALCSPASAGLNPNGFTKLPVHALLLLTLDGNTRVDEVRGTLPRRFGALGHASWRVLRLGATNAGSDATVSETSESPAFAETAEAAVQAAQQTAAMTALGRLVKRPGVLPYSGSSVLVSILGAGSYTNYQQLLRVLGALPGVTRAEPRRFLPAASGGAGPADELIQVVVHTTSTPESLGAALGRTPLSGIRLQVAPQGQGELRVLCAPGSALPTELPADPPPPEGTDPAAALPAPIERPAQ